MSDQNKTKGKKPAFEILFAPDNEKAQWTKLTAAWDTKTDGTYRSAELTVLPAVPGRLIIRAVEQ